MAMLDVVLAFYTMVMVFYANPPISPGEG